MTAEIIRLSDAGRRADRASAADAKPPFVAAPEQLAPIREAILYALLCRRFAEAMTAIEEFIRLDCADNETRFIRDGAALALCAVLCQKSPRDDHFEFADGVTNFLFPIFTEPCA